MRGSQSVRAPQQVRESQPVKDSQPVTLKFSDLLFAGN